MDDAEFYGRLAFSWLMLGLMAGFLLGVLASVALPN